MEYWYDKMNPKQELIDLLKTKACKIGSFTLLSGKQADLFIDCKQVCLTSYGHYLASRILYEEIENIKEQYNISKLAVAGVELGGCPLASGVSLYSYKLNPIDCLYVRKTRKDHGTGKLIEGSIEPGIEVILLEDVVTTGKSSLEAVKNLKEAGYNVFGIISLVDRMDGGKEEIEKLGLKFVSICTKDKILT